MGMVRIKHWETGCCCEKLIWKKILDGAWRIKILLLQNNSSVLKNKQQIAFQIKLHSTIYLRIFDRKLGLNTFISHKVRSSCDFSRMILQNVKRFRPQFLLSRILIIRYVIRRRLYARTPALARAHTLAWCDFSLWWSVTKWKGSKWKQKPYVEPNPATTPPRGWYALVGVGKPWS